MKFSSCITAPSIIGQKLDDIFAAFIEYGFEGVDIPCEPEIYPLDVIKTTYSSYSDKIGIGEITACINPNRDLMNPDKTKRNKAIDYIKTCIEFARDLGRPLTHLCFITTPEILRTHETQELYNLALDSFRKCLKFAEDNSVTLLLEPLYSGDNTIIKTSKQAVNFIADAMGLAPEDIIGGNINGIGLLQDLFHMHSEESDLIKSLRKYNRITKHIHLADHFRDLDFNFPESLFVKESLIELKKLNYDGFVSFESFNPRINLDTLKKALFYVKSYI
ncbi:MAG: sugar phosphate isomerase/epimerase family protein [Promethearchaeota archaeon]